MLSVYVFVAFNMRVLDGLPDGLLGGGANMQPSGNMMSPHQSQQPIHETHQNLTALLSTNTPPKDVNNIVSMNNSMVNSFSGPGPGQPSGPGGPNQYHNNMMTNGPSSANYASSGYNAAVSYPGGSPNLMYSSSGPSSSSYSLAVSNSMSALSNQQPGMNTMQSAQQQHSGMVQQGQQQPAPPQQHAMQQPQPGTMNMMNGPSSVMGGGGVMPHRSLPNNNMTQPGLPNSQVPPLVKESK